MTTKICMFTIVLSLEVQNVIIHVVLPYTPCIYLRQVFVWINKECSLSECVCVCVCVCVWVCVCVCNSILACLLLPWWIWGRSCLGSIECTLSPLWNWGWNLSKNNAADCSYNELQRSLATQVCVSSVSLCIRSGWQIKGEHFSQLLGTNNIHATT